MILQSSQRLPELLFYTKKSYKILQLQFQLQFRLQSYTCTIQRILHAEDKGLFEYYSSTHRRQGDLLEMHPCVLQDIPGSSSCSRDIPDIPVIHDLPAFPGNSTMFQHSPIRMHIPQFYSSIGFQKTPPSTSWAITDIANIHSSKKGRCCDIGQIDRLFIIELFPLSSCQVIILIARMTFNCSTSCLMS